MTVEEAKATGAAQFDFKLLTQLGVPVTNLAVDSRRVKPGDTFVAYPGERTDGRKFIAQAVAAGASAVIWESEGFSWDPVWRVPNLGVRNLRWHAGLIAAEVCGNPSRKLWMIGITGTNGKTSCSHWLAQCLSELGRKTAIVGTLGNGFPDELAESGNTTPDAISLQASLKDFLLQGASCVAMEVSSHGLAQGRVNGMKFDVAVLTNLSRDHLDYHRDMKAYAAAKATLFEWPGLEYAVVNLNDEFGAELARILPRSGVKVLGYGLGQGDVTGRNLRLSAKGLTFEASTPWGEATLECGVLGRFNAFNLLATLSALLASGVALEDAVWALSRVKAVAGRMQCLGGNGKPLVVVDYAHTPDALEKVLQTLREVAGSAAKAARLICVFGCGGGRDRGKRPLMGAVASQLADSVIVTSDNPRGEDARAIIDEIITGLGANYRIEEDRVAAIGQAIQTAGPDDVVLIAGKGHEAYQEIAGMKLPFSDVEVAQRILQGYGSHAAKRKYKHDDPE